MKVLIVDDETIIRQGIERIINWENCGVDKVESCGSGEEAVKILPEYRPEIVLCDIKMKKLSGFDVLEFINKNMPETKLIFLTSYDDFNFAQKALRLGAYDYILKTASAEEITKLVADTVRTILEEQKQRKEIEILKNKVHLQPAKKINTVLNSVVSHEILPLNLESSRFITASLKIVFSVSLPSFSDEEILSILNKESGDQSISYTGKSNDFVIIKSYGLNKNDSDIYQDFLRICQNIEQKIRSEIKIPIKIGVSNIGSNYSKVPELYENAKFALGFSNRGGNNVLLYSQVKDLPEAPVHLDKSQEHKLIVALKSGQKGMIFSVLDEIFSAFEERSIVRQQEVRNLSINIFGLITSMINEMKSETLTIEAFSYDYIIKFNDYKNLKEYVYDSLADAAMKFAEANMNRAVNIIDMARTYIDSHYNENITLETIADLVHLSPNHFSNLFSEKMGVTFIQYLTNVRIEKAKVLLLNKSFKTYEVGDMVGYSNPHYFSRIFKKNTGMSPMEYREKLAKEKNT